jgi:hypothetical protein
MNKVFHFDYRPGLDKSFRKTKGHKYISMVLRPETYFYDETVTTISIFISSKITQDIKKFFPNLTSIMCRSA